MKRRNKKLGPFGEGKLTSLPKQHPAKKNNRQERPVDREEKFYFSHSFVIVKVNESSIKVLWMARSEK